MSKKIENELPKMRLVFRGERVNAEGKSTLNYFVRFEGKTINIENELPKIRVKLRNDKPINGNSYINKFDKFMGYEQGEIKDLAD